MIFIRKKKISIGRPLSMRELKCRMHSTSCYASPTSIERSNSQQVSTWEDLMDINTQVTLCSVSLFIYNFFFFCVACNRKQMSNKINIKTWTLVKIKKCVKKKIFATIWTGFIYEAKRELSTCETQKKK